MNLRDFGVKYPFLEGNLGFWEHYLSARDQVWKLLPGIISEDFLLEVNFLTHITEGKPFLEYRTISLSPQDSKMLIAAFCEAMELAMPEGDFPEQLPCFENLTITPDETGFIFAELHAMIASYIESVVTADEEEAINWLELNCPICGAGAGMGLIAPSGKKNLVCSHCQTVWVYSRTACGICGHIEEKGITFYTADEEPNWFMETCQECKGYMKVYDMRKAFPQIITYQLLYLTSWNLDLSMRDQGFEPALFQIFERAGWVNKVYKNSARQPN